MTRWVAPGKVVLVGEYAVVDGAPAIVAAVDSGVSVSWEPGPTRRIEAPDDRFVGPALEAVGAPPGRWRFDRYHGLDTATKAGLGSSAAATVVAVLAGLEARGESPSPDEVFRVAFDVHRRVQGSGSGVDVAASAHGGVVRFERGAARRVRAVAPVVVWSGASASTGPRVERYLAWRGRADFVARSRHVVDCFDEEPVAALADAGALLGSMAEAAGVAYWTDALLRIRDLAEEHGGAAKPSGAGGGDSAVALFPDAGAEAAFRAACAREGYPVLPLRVDGPARRVPQGRAAAGSVG